MKILPSGFSVYDVTTIISGKPNLKKVKHIQIELFNDTSVCKTKVITDFLENLIPEGAKKFEKKTEEVPEASKKSPRELPRPKMRPAKSRDGLQKGPWDPRGAPEANQD